jgi:hypothetical protein
MGRLNAVAELRLELGSAPSRMPLTLQFRQPDLEPQVVSAPAYFSWREFRCNFFRLRPLRDRSDVWPIAALMKKNGGSGCERSLGMDVSPVCYRRLRCGQSATLSTIFPGLLGAPEAWDSSTKRLLIWWNSNLE